MLITQLSILTLCLVTISLDSGSNMSGYSGLPFDTDSVLKYFRGAFGIFSISQTIRFRKSLLEEDS